MSNLESSEPPLNSLNIALRVSRSIRDITDYYRAATERLFDNDGNAKDPVPEAVLGSLGLNAARRLILEHSTQGQEAMLSVLWSDVESAQKSFLGVAAQFETKIDQSKAAESRWTQVDEDAIRKSARASELMKMFEELVEARWAVPRIPRVSIPKPPTRSLLDPEDKLREMFDYAPLESPKETIRLVKMESVSDSLEFPICLTTRTIHLQDNIPFATLSYTWGKPFGVFCSETDRDAAPRIDIPISCDGRLLQIGENLYRFLCRWRQALANFDKRMSELRHEDPSDLGLLEGSRPPEEFWIDAICINQEDLEEKSQQVSIMGDVYSKSSVTWVWLGEHDLFSRDAFGVLQSLVDLPESAGDESVKSLHVNDELLVNSGLPDTNSWKWFAVFALFQRQWFRRSWVVQEAALSARIIFQCGSLNVPFPFIMGAFMNIKRFGFLEDLICITGMNEVGPTRFELMLGRSTRGALLKKSSKTLSEQRYLPCREGVEQDFFGMIKRIMRIRALDPRILNHDKKFIEVEAETTFDKVSALLDLWKLSRNTLCGNPRDKVYALASLTNSATYETSSTVRDRRALEPDYNKSVCEVYCEAAWFTLLTHSSLDLLSISGHTALNDDAHGLPSWVPNLSQSPRFLSLYDYSNGNPSIGWLASGCVGWNIPAPSQRYGRHLGVQVLFVGQIQSTDAEEPDFSNSEALKVNFEQILKFSTLLPSTTYLGRPDGQNRWEVLWRTIIADTIHGVSLAPHKYGVEFETLYVRAIKEALNDQAIGDEHDGLFGTLEAMKDLGRLQHHSAWDVAKQAETDETANFRKRVTATMDKRRLFVADTGHVGCGDSRLDIGDWIVVIAGCPVPFLLRAGYGGRYMLVGEAYVHGVMFGEWASRPDAEWEHVTLE